MAAENYWSLVTGYRTEKNIFRVSLVIFLVRMVFVLHLLRRITHQNLSPCSSVFITPCLVASEMISYQKFISASFRGLAGAKNQGC